MALAITIDLSNIQQILIPVYTEERRVEAKGLGVDTEECLKGVVVHLKWLLLYAASLYKHLIIQFWFWVILTRKIN